MTPLRALMVAAMVAVAAAARDYYAYDGRRLVRVSRGEDLVCQMWGHRKVIDDILARDDVRDKLVDMSVKELTNLIDTCHLLGKEDTDDKSILQGIYPGTKWCGNGNIAENDDDLGTYVETDKCCRSHDKCDRNIGGGDTAGPEFGSLTNTSPFTRSHCDCDHGFMQCLGRDSSENKSASCAVAELFFNIINTVCFREDHPIVRCAKKGGFLWTKCIEYELDTSQSHMWQFFDTDLWVKKTHGC